MLRTAALISLSVFFSATAFADFPFVPPPVDFGGGFVGSRGTVDPVPRDSDEPEIFRQPPSSQRNSSAAGAQYLGCYKDDSRRDLNDNEWSDGGMTLDKCVSFCRGEGFAYAGAQHGTQCFCGNRYGKYGQTSEKNCSEPCGGNTNLNCGGAWANSIFKILSGPSSGAVSIQPRNSGTGARYLGCYRDDSRRDLKEKEWSNGKMTPDKCVNFCRKEGFAYAGAQYGTQCFCGDSYGKYGQIPEKNCSAPCGGDTDLNCGGTWANSVFQLR